ncbi:MAG: 5'-nucleotidase C-terminal domain-containing protein [Pseudomonadota bacterium]
MKHLVLMLVAGLLATPAAADFTLTILHTNDFHARFEPISKFDSTCAPEDNDAGDCFGGSARLLTAIEDARAAAENPVLVDAGDQFQGTLFYTYYKGQLAAEMMNRMRYDAMTVGNHEFDDGPEVLRGFIDTVDFPVLMSNAHVHGDEHLSGAIQKSTVIQRGGEWIGLIGITPEDTHLTSSPGEHVHFHAAIPAVQAEVDRLTAEGITKIILLSHTGYRKDLEIAKAVTGVDVIVGGHTNTYLANDDPAASGPYPTMVGDVAVVQAYAYGKFLGKLKVVFDAAGDLVSATGDPSLMDAGVTEDPSVKARIAEAAIPLDEIRNRVVAEVATAIDAGRANCRFRECQMGTLVADAMMARLANQGVEAAITNGGGLRAGIDAGEVTMGEVLTVLPFQNTLSTFRVSGQTLLEALEHGVSEVTSGDGRFPQVAGMQFSIAVTAPKGERIKDLMVAGAPVELDRMYLMATNNFMRTGGDGYAMFKDAEDAYDFGPDVADVLADYLAENTPYTPYTDGRITLSAR